MQDSHTSKPEMNWGCQNYGHKNIKDQPGHHTSGSTLGDTSASCRSCNPFQNLTSGNYWGSGWWEMLGHQTLKLVTRCLMIIPFFLLCFSGGEHQNSCRSCSIVFARCENGEPASGFVVESCVEILFEHWWNVTCSWNSGTCKVFWLYHARTLCLVSHQRCFLQADQMHKRLVLNNLNIYEYASAVKKELTWNSNANLPVEYGSTRSKSPNDSEATSISTGEAATSSPVPGKSSGPWLTDPSATAAPRQIWSTCRILT